MSEFVKEIQGRTRILMKVCNFTWSIEKFSIICHMKTKEKLPLTSPTFTIGESSLTKWCIYLEFLDESAIGIFLRRTSSDASTHHVSFDVSIIGSDKIKHHTYNSKGNLYDNHIDNWGREQFIERKELLEEKQLLLLPNDTLTVTIELKVSKVDDLISKLEEETEAIHSSAPVVFKETDSLVGSLQRLYESKICSDFTIKVGDEELKVHKLILCARSSVFYTMLNSDMKESITNSVEITDFDPPVVKTMLRYIYCEQIEDLTPEISIQLYSIADKYNIPDLKDICIKYLLKNLDVDNICDALVLGELHNEAELMAAAKKMFGLNAAAIQKTEKWFDLSKTMPDLVFSMYQFVISQNET